MENYKELLEHLINDEIRWPKLQLSLKFSELEGKGKQVSIVKNNKVIKTHTCAYSLLEKFNSEEEINNYLCKGIIEFEMTDVFREMSFKN